MTWRKLSNTMHLDMVFWNCGDPAVFAGFKSEWRGRFRAFTMARMAHGRQVTLLARAKARHFLAAEKRPESQHRESDFKEQRAIAR